MEQLFSSPNQGERRGCLTQTVFSLSKSNPLHTARQELGRDARFAVTARTVPVSSCPSSCPRSLPTPQGFWPLSHLQGRCLRAAGRGGGGVGPQAAHTASSPEALPALGRGRWERPGASSPVAGRRPGAQNAVRVLTHEAVCFTDHSERREGSCYSSRSCRPPRLPLQPRAGA